MSRQTEWPLERLNRIFSGLDGAKGFALAVSGGADSRALLHLFHAWHETAGNARPVMIFTVDHGLRPDAAMEAERVEAAAAKCGFLHKTLRWTSHAASTRIQQRAREARYRLLTDACHKAGLSHLLLAHHLDDQAETVLMRVLRGGGIDGLAAMRKVMAIHGITAVRPLLGCRKRDLQGYLSARGICWIDDPSNLDERFERVRMRALLKHISAGTPDAAEGLARLAARTARASQALDWYAARAFEDIATIHQAGFCVIALERFTDLPDETRLRVLAHAMRIVSGGRPLKLDALETALPALQAKGPGYVTTLGYTVVSADHTSIFVVREAGRGVPETQLIQSGETVLWDQRMAVTLSSKCPPLRAEPLGERWAQARDALPGLPDIAPSVRPMLLSMWEEGRLVALPGLDAALEGIDVTVMFPIRDEGKDALNGPFEAKRAGN